jgi:GT2 family glycosyltransferase
MIFIPLRRWNGFGVQRDQNDGAGSDVTRDEIVKAISDLERHLSEKLDRLSVQTIQTAQAVDRLSYAVSLKGRTVGFLRRTGLLSPVAAALNSARSVLQSKTPVGPNRGAAADGQVMQIAANISLRSPLVITSTDPLTAALDEANLEVLRLRPSVAAPTTLLAAPDRDSLGGWLAYRDLAEVRRIKTFVVDQDQNGVALNLLRGRLAADQSILLVRPSDTAPLPAWLGQPDAITGRLAYFKSMPTDWLDVLDNQGQPQPILVAARKWPKISMVMVSFNQAVFLEEGIRSVLDQGYPNLEFIVVDGGSTDGSVEILERYRARLDCLVIERDKGQSDGLNKGFDRATGDILSWLNSDDLLFPGALFRVSEAFQLHGVDIVAGGCKQVKQDGRDLVVAHHNHLPFGFKTPLPLADLLDFDNKWQGGAFFYQPEVFFSHDIWRRSGGGLRLDLYYVLDYDLWVRMAAAGATVVHIPDFLAASRIHDQQKTKFGENPFVPEARRLLAEMAGGVRWTRP